MVRGYETLLRVVQLFAAPTQDVKRASYSWPQRVRFCDAGLEVRAYLAGCLATGFVGLGFGGAGFLGTGIFRNVPV